MIARYNLKQAFLLPLHLVIGIASYWLIWMLCGKVTAVMFDRFEPWLSSQVLDRSGMIGRIVASAVLLAATWEGWQMWRAGIAGLPGMCEDIFPQTNLGPGAGSARFDLAIMSFEFRVLANIALSGPLQCLAAWQRIQNRIPDTARNRARIEEWKAFAESQKSWHSESLYRRDETALEWLIRMGFLDHSPTKGLVAVRGTGE